MFSVFKYDSCLNITCQKRNQLALVSNSSPLVKSKHCILLMIWFLDQNYIIRPIRTKLQLFFWAKLSKFIRFNSEFTQLGQNFTVPCDIRLGRSLLYLFWGIQFIFNENQRYIVWCWIRNNIMQCILTIDWLSTVKSTNCQLVIPSFLCEICISNSWLIMWNLYLNEYSSCLTVLHSQSSSCIRSY